MADDGATMSVKERIAQLKLNQVGHGPGQPSPLPSYDHAMSNGTTSRPRPPPPPARPDLPPRPGPNGRAAISNISPLQDHLTFGYGEIEDQPAPAAPVRNANGMDGISRPALPPRTGSQASQASLSPALPPRTVSGSPALPPRRTSEAPSTSDRSLVRRDSNDSISSIATARSSLSGISNATSRTSQHLVRAPSYDPSTLPALPPKRTQEEKDKYYTTGTKANNYRRALKQTVSSPNVAPKQEGTTPPPPRRPSVQIQAPLVVVSHTRWVKAEPDQVVEAPQKAARMTEASQMPVRIVEAPRMPARVADAPQMPARIAEAPQMPARPTRTTAPPPTRRSPLELGMNKPGSEGPSVPQMRPNSTPAVGGAPPPIPTGSRPDLAALQASKPKANGVSNGVSTDAGSCLHCRNFSGPDTHAAKFPRKSLSSFDMGWLAQQLTAPFDSATDKARALFTWQHHNIAYNTVAFFNNAVKSSTPQSTLETGLAVCEGYAGLFAAMAIKAGLEALVVSGHGKGYGYSPLKPGDPVPPFNTGHAWSAVKIDGGRWKLLDCCWGAGSVGGKDGRSYIKGFKPERFTQTNEDFGLDHYPSDNSKQFRSDRRIVTWEEYMCSNKDGSAAQHFSGWDVEEGINPKSFRPVANPIVLADQGPTVRFSFQKICPHWDPVRNGKGPHCLYILHLDGLDGKPKQNIPFQTNGDVWWCDADVRDLGRPGQKAHIWAVSSLNGREPPRGLTAREFKRDGMCSGFGFVMTWTIA